MYTRTGFRPVLVSTVVIVVVTLFLARFSSSSDRFSFSSSRDRFLSSRDRFSAPLARFSFLTSLELFSPLFSSLLVQFNDSSMAAPAQKKIMRVEIANLPTLANYTYDYLKEIATANELDLTGKNKEDLVTVISALPNYILMPITITDDWPKKKTRHHSASSSDDEHGKHLRNIQPFDEKKHDIQAWLNTCERQLKRQKFTADDWPGEVEPFLTGTALRAFDGLLESEKDDWKTVTETILKAYNINEEAYRKKIRTRNKYQRESYVEYGNVLRQLFIKWVKAPDTLLLDKDFVRISETLIVEQLIKSISDKGLQRKLAELEPKTLKKVTEKADRYLSSKDFSYGSSQNDDSSSKKPWKRGKDRKHDSRDTKGDDKVDSANSSSEKPAWRPRCHECNELGHLRPLCPKLAKDNVPGGKDKKKKTESVASISLATSSPRGKVDGCYAHIFIQNQPYLGYLDNGAAISIINQTTANNLELDIIPAEMNLVAANNTAMKIVGKTKDVTFKMGNIELFTSFMVSDLTDRY